MLLLVESHGNVDEHRPNSEILGGFWRSQWQEELVSKPGEQGQAGHRGNWGQCLGALGTFLSVLVLFLLIAVRSPP